MLQVEKYEYFALFPVLKKNTEIVSFRFLLWQTRSTIFSLLKNYKLLNNQFPQPGLSKQEIKESGTTGNNCSIMNFISRIDL